MPTDIELRAVTEEDLPLFFEQMHDPAASLMAAHTPRQGDAFYAHWRKIMADPATTLRAIVVDGAVAGHVASWPAGEQRLLGYWIGRRWWGRGVATAALTRFLAIFDPPRLHAHVARHNLGSIRVLEKCGFVLDAETTAALGPPPDGVPELVYVLLRT